MPTRRIRSCPRCSGNFAVTIDGSATRGESLPVDGRCIGCGYEIAWQVFFGKPPTRTLTVRTFALITLIFLAAATVIRCAPPTGSDDSTVRRTG